MACALLVQAPGSSTVPDEKQEEFGKAAYDGRLSRMRELWANGSGGIDKNWKNSTWAAIHRAAWNGHDGCISFLVDVHANVNLGDKDGDTAAHNAAARDHVSCLRVLHRANADLSIKNNNNQTPLELAKAKGKTAATEYLESVQVGRAWAG